MITVEFRVWYAGGETDHWTETISRDMYHYYNDGGQGPSRLKQMAEKRDYKGRTVNMITMVEHV